MPVILQEQALLDLTRAAVTHLTTEKEASLYVICNRLHVCTKEELARDLEGRFGGNVTVVNEPGVVRSVAGSWNLGAEMAMADGATFVTFVANDTRLRANCLDEMATFGQRTRTDLWSGISSDNGSEIDPARISDGADFTCFMLRPETLATFGWFDPNFRPAYFEDNDYYARVVLGGGECRVVHAAQFYHHGSATLRMDEEAAHHVRHWFEVNRSYFLRKWGVSQPANSQEDVRAQYYRHPFNDASRPVSWFPAAEQG
jgi:hypothetical protein